MTARDLDSLNVGSVFQKRQLLRLVAGRDESGTRFSSSRRPKSFFSRVVLAAQIIVLIATGYFMSAFDIFGSDRRSRSAFADTDDLGLDEYSSRFRSIEPIYRGRCDGNSSSNVAIAVGIVSALHNTKLRSAARETWIRRAKSELGELMAYRFFLGIDENGQIPTNILDEARLHRDIVFTGVRDTYGSIGFKVVSIFRWGVRQCGAHYVIRANDDAYVRVATIFSQIRNVPPVAIMAGHMFEAGAAIVTRPNDAEYECRTARECAVRDKARVAQVVTVGTYPSEKYGAFAQGNCVLLSRDLAEEVASLDAKPWYRPFYADDVMIGTIVGKWRPRLIHIPADMGLHERATRCQDTSVNHFDIGPRSMRMLDRNDGKGVSPCSGISVFPD